MTSALEDSADTLAGGDTQDGITEDDAVQAVEGDGVDFAVE